MTRVALGRCLAIGVLLSLATVTPVAGDYRLEKELALSPGGEFTAGGAIDVSEIGARVDARTSGGSIHLKGLAGEVKASTSGGSVTVHLTSGNSLGGSLRTSGSRVTVYLDPTAALDIEASTSGGAVTLDLPVSVQGEISRRKVRGTLNGGGVLLRLRTSAGGVRVRSL